MVMTMLILCLTDTRASKEPMHIIEPYKNEVCLHYCNLSVCPTYEYSLTML